MKNFLIASLLVFSSVVSASEITLTHRNLGPADCANDSCYYDFYNMTQEYGYGLSLEFGNDWGENEFSTVQVVDEIGLIVDLGKMSCKDIENEYENSGSGYPSASDRQNDPMFWLTYSTAWDKLQNGGVSETVKAQKGHCYLMYKASMDQRVIVAFHVKDLTANVSVVLDEVEVFNKASITNN